MNKKLTKYKKNKLSKSKKIVLSFFLIILTLGVGYSALISNLSISGNILVKKYERNLFNIISHSTDECISKYEGQVTDQVGQTVTASNVYFDKCADKRNVIFAGLCWQIVRTTETGGIKMIYNGEPDDGKCLSTREGHTGIVGKPSKITALNDEYLYGTSFTYDTDNSTFTLVDTNSAIWSDSTYSGLIGKYTCKNNTGTCTTLYYVGDYDSNNFANVGEYNIKETYYGIIGEGVYNTHSKSLAMVGYMYNKVYKHEDRTHREVMLYQSTLSTDYWYADSMTWAGPATSVYNLINPYKISSTSEYNTLIGKYTFSNNKENYSDSSIKYITAINGTSLYYISLSNSKQLSDVDDSYTYGDSFVDNGDGTYTITNQNGNPPTTFYKHDWYSYYSSIGQNKYVCKNASNNTCSELWITTRTNETNMFFRVYENYLFASGFTYDENTGKYTLNNDRVTFWNASGNYEKEPLKTRRYTCWNSTGICEKIHYAFSISETDSYNIKMTDGKDINDALNEMLYNNDVNAIDSGAKGIIDNWYNHSLSSKTSMLEDVVYCNERDISDYGYWDQNNISTNTFIQFNNYTLNNDLSCNHLTDQFSISNNKAKLKYPIGLLQSEEAYSLESNDLRKAGFYWYTMSPYHYFNSNGYSSGVSVRLDGTLYFTGSGSAFGYRPSISLTTDASFQRGSGSEIDPWIIQE